MSLKNTSKIETNKYELTVAVDAKAFEEGIEKAFRKNIKSINVPGFRKGKAPRKMVEKIYGEGVFFEDAINEIYPYALKEAVDEAKLTLVDRPEVEVKEVSREAGFEFVAICITKPEVAVKNYKGIKAQKVVKTVLDDAVSSRLASMQDRNARQINITDRAAELGDTVVFDFDGSVDKVPFDGGKAEKFSLELGSGQFIPGFEEQVVGKKIDEEFDVKVKFPEDYHAEELKGKDAVFACRLHEIKGKELPELDDEFAKDVSEFDTLDDLKKDIKEKMQQAADKESDTSLENQLVDTVIENMTAEIPQVMFENRIDEMVRDFEYRLQSQGMNMELYLQYTGMPLESFRQTFEEQAQKFVKIHLALEEIAKLENMTASEEEVNAEYEKLATAYNLELDKIKTMLPSEDVIHDVLNNKAIDLIKSSAVVTEVAEADAPAKKATAKKAAVKKATAKAEDKGEEKPKKTPAKKAAAKKTEE